MSLLYDRRSGETLAAIQRRAAIESDSVYCTVSYDTVTIDVRTAPKD